MTKKVRNHAREYRRRIERATARGLSKSQARGHPKPGEAPIRKTSAPKSIDAEMESIRKAIASGFSLTKASKTLGVSRERARRYIATHGIAEFKQGKWVITDKRPRQAPIASKGQQKIAVLTPYDASLAGRYANAAKYFLNTNDPAHLEPYRGVSVKDVRTGRKHVLETDPNALHRIATVDEPSFPEIYQIVAE